MTSKRTHRFAACAVAALVSIVTAFASALACEPCADELDFKKSSLRADLIVIGERIDYSPEEAESIALGRGPDFIKVRLIEVLKGSESRSELRIHSWFGMCGYGIVIDDRKHMLLLERKGEVYDSIAGGCAFKAALVEDGKVLIEGRRLSFERVKELFE